MKKIAVIGAGLSGLATAKVFIEAGQDVTVFEKSDSLAGVWAKSRSYPQVRTQTTRDEYSFSDFKMPDSYPEWPTGEQVEAYLTDYANHFLVYPCIRFNHEVKNMERVDKFWRLTLLTPHGALDYAFDFVIVCTGTFHKPFIPSYPNAEGFINAGGQILHSSELRSIDQLKHKKVTVVGFAKSATDIASLAAEHAQSSSLIYRKAQWKVPRFFANKINMKYLLFSRFSEAFFSYHHKTLFEKVLHSFGKPMVWMQWRALEQLLTWQFKLKKHGLVPAHRIEDQISCSLGVEPEQFYEKINKGTIQLHNSVVLTYENKKVVLANDQAIDTDLIIYGTGFVQEFPFLPLEYRNMLYNENGGLSLYRNILHPDIPSLAFVGFNSSLFTTLTSEVAAHWVMKYVTGALSLPPKEKLHISMRQVDNWRQEGRPIASEFSGSCIAPFNYHHLDELLTDMGLKTQKTGRVLYEFFKPINPADYKTILENKNNEYSR